MIELADTIYSRVLEGVFVLWNNPVECAAVGLLQGFVLVVMGLLALRISSDLVTTRLMKRSAEELKDPRARRALEEVVSSYGRKLAPPLFVAREGTPVAFTVGYLRPSLFLAPQLLERLDDEELRAVLYHEVAHVVRRDNLMMRVFRMTLVVLLTIIPIAIACSLYVSQSGMHFGSVRAKLIEAGVLLLLLASRPLWRSLSFLGEISCDERAVRAGADPVALAGALASVWLLERSGSVSRRIPILELSGGSVSAVERRIERLLELDTERAGRRPCLRVISGITLAMLLLFMGSYHVRSAASTKPPLTWSKISPP